MAGSYGHCEKHRDEEKETYENDRGETVINSYGFHFDHIENMGDAHEACEHMYYMIQHLAGGDQNKIREAVDAAYELMRRKAGGVGILDGISGSGGLLQ